MKQTSLAVTLAIGSVCLCVCIFNVSNRIFHVCATHISLVELENNTKAECLSCAKAIRARLYSGVFRHMEPFFALRTIDSSANSCYGVTSTDKAIRRT